MAGMGSGASGAPRSNFKRNRTRFWLFWTVLVFGGGFYAGVTSTKHAMTAPAWVARLFGVAPAAAVVPAAPAPPPAQPAVTPQTAPPPAQPTTTPTQTPSAAPQPPATTGSPAAPAGSTQTPGNTTSPTNTTAPPADSAQHSVVGKWEIVDQLHPTGSTPYKVTSTYVFDADGTGEFDANGKRMFDLQWEDADDYLMVTYDNTDPNHPEQKWKVKLKYSLNSDGTSLTLVSDGEKDAREAMYVAGPGVYHRK